MSEAARAVCRRNSWYAALGAGVFVALLLMLVAGYSFLSAVFIGLIVLVLLGAFLVWAFCSRDIVSATNAPATHPAAQPSDAAGRAVPAANATPAARAEASDPVAVSSAAVAAPAMAAPVPEAPQPAAPAAGTSTAEAAPKTRAPRKAAAKPTAKPAAKPAKPAAKAPRAAAKPKAAKPAVAAADTATATGLDAALSKSKDTSRPGEPILLSAPRGDKADDLKMIKGIGPKLEKLLNETGVWHFDQIASWKARDIAVVDEKMVGFHGRITRDEWVKQAKLLAKGGATEFSSRVANGGVY